MLDLLGAADFPGLLSSQLGNANLVETLIFDYPAPRQMKGAVISLEPHVAPPAAQHCGFMARAQRFDYVMFGILWAEASAVDPQQRLLLETGYEATHGAFLRRCEVHRRDLGIFVQLSARWRVEG